MSTRVTVKGQVTIPKTVRDAVGIKPGDEVQVHATADGSVRIKKPSHGDSYLERLYAIARHRPPPRMTTDELMRISRGDPGDEPPSKK